MENNAKSYSSLIVLPTLIERFEYLKIGGTVGVATFGGGRYLNQLFYHSKEWLDIRDEIITRDLGRNLAMIEDIYNINGPIYIHHINPLSLEALRSGDYSLALDPENLICCDSLTHKAIHYGDKDMLSQYEIFDRKPFDTCPWRTI